MCIIKALIIPIPLYGETRGISWLHCLCTKSFFFSANWNSIPDTSILTLFLLSKRVFAKIDASALGASRPPASYWKGQSILSDSI